MHRQLVIFALLLGACGDGTSLPQPVPVPAPQLSAILQSTPQENQTDVMLVGLPGAVAGAGQVVATTRPSGLVTAVPSNAQGSFALVVARGESIELRYQTPAGERSEAALLAPTRQTFGPELTESDATPGGVVSAPDAQGFVTVSNGSPQQILASPNVTVLVSNANSGDVVTGTTDGGGLFSLRLRGASGQEILILLSDATESQQTSDFLAYRVP